MRFNRDTRGIAIYAGHVFVPVPESNADRFRNAVLDRGARIVDPGGYYVAKNGYFHVAISVREPNADRFCPKYNFNDPSVPIRGRSD